MIIILDPVFLAVSVMIKQNNGEHPSAVFSFSRLSNLKYVKNNEFVLVTYVCGEFVGTYEYMCNAVYSKWKY